MLKITDGKKGESNITPNLPVNVVLAENQDDYQKLPCNYENETVAFSFDLTDEDIEVLKKEKKIYVGVITFGAPFHPIRVTVGEKQFEQEVLQDHEYVLEQYKKIGGEPVESEEH